MSETLENIPYVRALLARQPIFDRAKTVRGYELLFRDKIDDQHAAMTDETMATMRVVANAMHCIGPCLSGEHLVMINFSRQAILQNVPYALPPSPTVVEFDPCPDSDRQLLTILERLKADGYRLSLDGLSDRPGHDAALALADFIKIDALAGSRDILAQAVSRAGDQADRLLAKRVETAQAHAMALDLGYSWFQGFFFQRPEMVPGRVLPSNQAARLRLFRLIEQEDMDVDRLVETIEADVAICFRLLSCVNAAAFGLSQKVTSIRRAILLLGWRQLRNWLRVIIFTDLAPKARFQELSHNSVLRGKFLELVAQAHGIADPAPSSLFLLGLFSLLEPLLNLPMASILADLPLEEDLKLALTGQDNVCARWLRLAQGFESADWTAMNALREDFGLDPARIAKSYFEALEWTNSFFKLNV